ncbi:Lipid A export ATP-binding/permease protein MsbA [Paenibacillus pasadenensis]|uniref:Lipid A export ATP-binding/permease protein MsbA n=1 Tax=Paenibacillus pasadenensis TaxID=217090 RepID=A0A2N5ND78_9BACL|nr:ABC transporter ATP-binding protein [Paenibacillus pasadenensis]PLT48283.1 Lipid A export ATP-binding/permease protein MsbA [Paenibacillus pasadenensis]
MSESTSGASSRRMASSTAAPAPAPGPATAEPAAPASPPGPATAEPAAPAPPPGSATTEPAAPRAGWRDFVRLIAETKPPRGLSAAALTLSLLATVAGLVVPLATKQFIDGFSLSRLTGGHIALLAVFFLLQAAGGAYSSYLLARIGQHVVARLRERLWRKLMALPVPYYDRHQTGETVSRMTSDTLVVRGLITDHLVGFVTGLISAAGALVLLLLLDWRMTLILLVAIPLLAGIMVPLGIRMNRIAKATQDETAGFSGHLNNVVSEVRLVKASGAEQRELREGLAGIRRLQALGVREGATGALVGPSISLTIMTMLVVIIGYGGVRVSSGAITAGDLVAFILYLMQIILPLSQVAVFFTQFNKAMGATERINGMLAEPEERFEEGLELARADRPIVAEGLSFGYAGGEPILKDLGFTLQPGQVTAIVGPSGGGKTTLFSLLERYYEPTSGRLLLGGQPIGSYSLASWRARIGYVAQESPLMAGTIRDNMTYGIEREPSAEELREAARLAYADEFIDALPDGYDTQVGERGIKLSGGQRQRIGIARALLRAPDLLLLDEATSALDSQSEIVVQQALGNLMEGRTTVVIAHRLSTVVDADQILFVEKGRITGRGTHEELLASHALYREFAERQLRTPAAPG